MALSPARTLLVVLLTLAVAGCVENPAGWCTSDSDCPSGTQCIENLCLAQEPVPSDGGTTDAGAGSDAGNPSDGGGPQCAGGKSSCAQAADCASLICHAHCCSDTCSTSADCPTGDTCTAGVCQAPGCHSAADCQSSPLTPVCQTSTGTCVACLSNSDCGDANKICTAHNRCVWAPGKCGTSRDCQTTAAPVCDTATETCVQCVFNRQCSSGQVCQSNTCVSTGCRTDQQCAGTPNTPHCDTQSGACVQCTTDSQCSMIQQCTKNTCTLRPGDCQTDADCTSASARFCDTSSSKCVGCLMTEQCGPGQTCQNNACMGSVGACRHDADCALRVCVPQADNTHSTWVNQCVFGSVLGATPGGGACRVASDCASGVCHLPNANGADGVCIDACVSSADCAKGAQCPANGVSIYLPATSAGGMQMLATAAICWPRACSRDSDCKGLGTNGSDWTCGLTPDPLRPTTDVVAACYPTIGTGRGGQPCTGPSDCASGWCQTWTKNGTTRNECFEACLKDSDCPAGVRCYTGIQLLANEVGKMNTCASF